MNWADRELKKHRMRKEVERAMNTAEYRAIRNKEREEDTYFAMGQIAYFTMEYLEMKHRYGHDGLTDWLEFLKGRVCETAEDPHYLTHAEEYYREKHRVEIAPILGFTFVRREQA
jgi:hypothetical protein